MRVTPFFVGTIKEDHTVKTKANKCRIQKFKGIFSMTAVVPTSSIDK